MGELINTIVANYFQALGHPTRIEILELLKSRNEMCVCEIVEELKKEQSNISRHLNALKRVNILSLRAEGARSFYKVKSTDVEKILGLVKSVLYNQLKEGQKILGAL